MSPRNDPTLSIKPYDEELIRKLSLSEGKDGAYNQCDDLIRTAEAFKAADLTPVMVMHIPTQKIIVSTEEVLDGKFH